MRHRNTRPETVRQRVRRAIEVLRGRDDVDEHPDAWAHRARWWSAGESAATDRQLRAQAKNQ